MQTDFLQLAFQRLVHFLWQKYQLWHAIFHKTISALYCLDCLILYNDLKDTEEHRNIIFFLVLFSSTSSSIAALWPQEEKPQQPSSINKYIYMSNTFPYTSCRKLEEITLYIYTCLCVGTEIYIYKSWVKTPSQRNRSSIKLRNDFIKYHL